MADMVLPEPRLCLLELPAAEAAGVRSGWAQRLLCFAGTEAAAAAPGRLREQQRSELHLGRKLCWRRRRRLSWSGWRTWDCGPGGMAWSVNRGWDCCCWWLLSPYARGSVVVGVRPSVRGEGEF